MDVKDRVFWVMGLARSGCAAGALLRRHGARVIGLDDKGEDEIGRRWESEGLSDLAPRAFDELTTGGDSPPVDPDGVIISPGVPLDHSRLAGLKGDIPVLGELELGARFCAARQVAVTGTNGKTTTTEWLAHLGRQAGLESYALGNVGRPLCSVAEELSREALAIIEVSSFQLESVVRFQPEVGIVLNLAPDHLDRYPDLASYYGAKRNLARIIPSTGSFLTWTECPEALQWETPGRRILFGDQTAGATVYFRDGRLCADRDGEAMALLSTEELSLQSPPNLLNAMACSAAALSLGLSPEAITRGLGNFQGLAHRHELVAEKGPVRFINDTKATNVHAVCAGLQGCSRPVVLIVGGSGKGEDYAPMRDVMGSVDLVILLGEEGPIIGDALAGSVSTTRAGSMEEAVATATQRAEKMIEAMVGATLGKTVEPMTAPQVDVLLSPACASFDMFANYRKRGEAFTAAALKIGAVAT
ncbi:MAG: UDP-N-acetylmuramoyl-L-alanine--D-glutamate ligase [Gemmatimonadales bacterium]|nr:UDP-N-acetylmuramoyl-L-alanine--D-glutamate ligase [Gemmatimonadales bacterium]